MPLPVRPVKIVSSPGLVGDGAMLARSARRLDRTNTPTQRDTATHRRGRAHTDAESDRLAHTHSHSHRHTDTQTHTQTHAQTRTPTNTHRIGAGVMQPNTQTNRPAPVPLQRGTHGHSRAATEHTNNQARTGAPSEGYSRVLYNRTHKQTGPHRCPFRSFENIGSCLHGSPCTWSGFANSCT